MPTSVRRLRIGGSPFDPELLGAVEKHGVDVGEWYGASETAVVAMTPFGRWRTSEIGPAIPDVDVRIADDHEILVRSPAQMTGYYGDESLTRETVTSDGFILTGDLGALAGDGTLRLIGRKKEVLNAPDGTNIAAAPIEARIAARPWVDQVVLVGDGRPFVAALIVLRDAPASAANDGFLDEAEHAELYARTRTELDAINAHLEPIEQIRGCLLFGRRFAKDLYAEVGLNKLRRDRAGLVAAHAARIDAMYARAAARPMADSPTWNAKAWNASADVYDSEPMSFFVRIGARAVELLDIASGDHVVDCACGSGNSSLVAAARVGATGKVIGVDVSSKMIELARAKAAARGLDNVEFCIGDMQEIALGAERFDAVLCVFGLFFVADMVRQVQTFWSHLKPGGRLGIAVWSHEALEPARRQIWLPSLKAEIPELLVRNSARDHVGEAEQIRATLECAGIRDATLITCREQQTLRSPDDWWELVRGLGPTRWLIDQMTPEQSARVRAKNVDWVRAQALARVNVDWIFARATKPPESMTVPGGRR